MVQSGKDLGVMVGEVVTGRAWKQWVFSFIAYLPFFTRSLQTGYLTSITHITQMPSPPNGVPWTTTVMVLGAVSSTPLSCWAADRFGRKVVAVAIGALQVIPIILLFSNQETVMIVVSNALVGIASSAIFVVLPTYVKETCQARTRGVALALMLLLSSSGHLLISILVMMVQGEYVLYGMAALGIVQLLLMFCLPETTSYYVIKEEFEKANKSLSNLKCLHVNSPNVIKEVDTLKSESNRAKTCGKLTLFQILKNQLWRDATKIGLVLVTCYTLGGNVVFLDHWKVLRIATLSVDGEIANAVVPSVALVGSLLCLVLITVSETRYILTISFALMTFGLGVLGVFMQSSSTTIPWLPITALLVTVFGWSLAWLLPFALLTEALNLEVRTTVIGVVYFYSQVLTLIHDHTFQYIEDYVGIHALCYVFSGVNMFGCVYAIFGVPETRGRSVRSIERQLKRIPPWEM